MKKVDEMIADIIDREKGYVNHPADKGGPTKYGVTQATLSMYLGRRATIEDVKNLTEDVADKIFKYIYYFTPKLDLLPEIIQPLVFDISVNSGPRKSIELFQDVLNDNGFDVGSIDGFVDAKTIKAAKEAYVYLGLKLVNLLVDRRIAFYKAIIRHDSTQKVFEKGWLARAESFRISDSQIESV